MEWLKKEINKNKILRMSELGIQQFIKKLYEKSYSALDMIKLVEDNYFKLDDEKKYELLVAFNKVRKECRNEKLLLLFVINFVFLDTNSDLENITFI